MLTNLRILYIMGCSCRVGREVEGGGKEGGREGGEEGYYPVGQEVTDCCECAE